MSAMSTASRKDKGRRLQQWVCKKIAELTGFEWGHDKPIESRGMGQCGVDVRLESCVLEKFPFSVECKNQESWAVHNWIKQAQENQVQGTDWLLVAKRNHNKPVVILDAEVFFKLLDKGDNKNNG